MPGPKKLVVRKVAEKKQPTPKPEPALFEKLKGQKVVVQSRAGTRYEGIFEAYKDGFFWLKEAVVVGNEFQAKTELLAVDRGQTAHLHLEPTEVNKKET
jgi:hypothetical protein